MVEETIQSKLGSQVSKLLVEMYIGKSCGWYRSAEDMLKESSEAVDGQIDRVTVVDKKIVGMSGV